MNHLVYLGRRLLAGAAALGILYAGTLAGLAWYLVRRVTSRRRPRRPAHYTFTPWEFGIQYRLVRIPQGHEELDAWYLPQADIEAPCILLLPGHGGNKSDLLGIATALHRFGFQCLLLDFRGTGNSTGDVITLGHYETEDAISAVDWLCQEIDPRAIGIIGFSLGGSVAITTAARDERIRAVVSDSAFASQYEVLAHQVRKATRHWPAPVLTMAKPMFTRRHGHHYDDFSPVEQVHRIAPRPLLIIHPEADQMVPVSHGVQLWERSGEPKELWVVPGVGHCGAYFEDRDTYCQRVAEFFRCALTVN